MIKVSNTKTHKISNGEEPFDYGEIVDVAEAQLVLVDHKLDISHTHTPRPLLTHDPILISLTEKIEVGDWYYRSDYSPFIYKDNDDAHGMCNCKKILALPEHFSPKHLQAIVDGKLKDGDRVLVECEKTEFTGSWDGGSPQVYKVEWSIKLNPHITIYPVEEKKYTREEIIKMVDYFRETLSDDGTDEWYGTDYEVSEFFLDGLKNFINETTI